MTTEAPITPGTVVVPIPRVALNPDEAAEALGVSRGFFDKHVLPEVAYVRRGRRILVTIKALEKWAEANAGR